MGKPNKEERKMPDSNAKKKWDAINARIFSVKLFRKTDNDVIEYLECHNRRDTICAAIREYIEKHKED